MGRVEEWVAKVPQQVDAKLMIQRGETWFARKAVPKDVQAVVGRKVFQKSTGERNFGRAYAKAVPWIDGWEAQITAARNAKEIDRAGLIADARARFAARKESGDDDEWEVAEEAIERLKRMGLIPESKDESGREYDPIITPIVEQVIGVRTPLDVAKERWIALDLRTMQARQASQYQADLDAFLEAHQNEAVETLTGRKVQEWIDNLAHKGGRSGSPATSGTIRRKLSALRGYWRRLTAEEYVKEGHKPFHDRTVPKQVEFRSLQKGAVHTARGTAVVGQSPRPAPGPYPYRCVHRGAD